MARLTFNPITSAPANIVALALALEEEYMVADHATHFALTEQGEAAIAYPTRDGRLILTYPLHDAAAYVELNERQKAATNEDEEADIIERRHLRLASPDEHEMFSEDIERADNGDGTFTLRARATLL